MTTYIITRKSDQAEMTRYAAAAPVEQINADAYPFTDFSHIEFVDGAVDTPVASATWTKLEYLRRFTQDERIAIRNAATQSPELQDYLELLALAEEIRSNDPDIMGTLTMLESAGLIGTGRAQEILHGQ